MRLYHEAQVASLCGVHCINTLLQGPYFSEIDLAQLGQELDELERQMMEEGGVVDADDDAVGNLDESGMFSVQVLTKALQVWGLAALNIDSEDVQKAEQPFEAHKEEAFICNLQEHWFTIRRVGGEYFNFNSLYPAPEALSAFYLTAYLDSLKQQGYTIFVIRGDLPQLSDAAAANGDMEEGGPGKWWAPEEARTAHETAQAARQMGRARKGVEDALARAAAAGGTLTLRSSGNKRGAASQHVDDEDADLAAAIAASMQDHAGGASSSWEPAAADSSYAAVAAAAAAGGGSSQQAQQRQRSRSLTPAAGAGSDLQGGSAAAAAMSGGFGGFEDDDPELAAALAASLEEHHNASQQQQQQSQQGPADPQQQSQQAPGEDVQASAEQPEQAVAVQVPEEPDEGAAGVLTVAFRLPSGARLSRRFCSTDTVAMLAAFAAQQMAASGEMPAGKRVVLSTQFPKKALEQEEQQLEAAGIEDRSILTVTLA